MMVKTRNVVAASALVLGVGLGTGLVAYYVGAQSGAASSAAEELRYVPASVSLVAAADVHAVMMSPLRERLRQMIPGEKGRGHRVLAEQTGINIDTDIDRIVAATGRRTADGRHPDSLVLARGRFDVVRIEAFMREKGGRVEEQTGKRLVIAPSEQGRGTFALAFMEPGLIAFGTEDMTRSAVALAGGGASVTSNDQIMGYVSRLTPGDAWIVGRFDELMPHAALPAGVGDRLPPIQWFSASVSVDSGVRGVVRAEMRDEAAADSLRDVVRGIVALVRLQSRGDAGVDAAVQSVTLGGTGRIVDLGFDLPAELFDSIAAVTGSRIR